VIIFSSEAHRVWPHRLVRKSFCISIFLKVQSTLFLQTRHNSRMRDMTPLKGEPGQPQDHAAAPPISFSESIEAATLGRAMLIQALEQLDFKAVGKATIGDSPAYVYQHETGDYAFALVENLFVPERNSLGGATVAQLNGRTTLLVVIPAPTTNFLEELASVALELQDNETITALSQAMKNCSPDSMQEVVGHEMTHFDDFRHSHWGRVAMTQALIDNGEMEITLSPAMASRVLESAPAPEENEAATLLMELKAFTSNAKTDPARHAVATECCNATEELLKTAERGDDQRVRDEISANLQRWQRTISTNGSSYQVGGDAAIALAVDWLLEEGTLKPESR